MPHGVGGVRGTWEMGPNALPSCLRLAFRPLWVCLVIGQLKPPSVSVAGVTPNAKQCVTVSSLALVSISALPLLR